MLFLPRKHTALAACAGLIASITVTSTTVPVSHAAEVGTCFTYTASGTKDQAAGAPAVDCSTPHTAQTYWIGTLPANFSVPAKAKASSRLKATRACTSKKMNAFLNLDNRELPTRFHSVPVFPTKAQWNAGERWVRCDVVFRSGKAYKKLSVPMAEFAAVTPGDQLNFCTPKVPGNRSTSAYPCTKVKKNWIMVVERDLGTPTKKFPGSRTVERQTKKICEKAAKPYVTLKKYYPWWAIWPNSTGWSRADRTAQCFVPYSEFVKNTINQ
jgi:hypothetical protein